MRPSKVIIDLAKLDRNIKNIKRMLKPNTHLMAIVKADAYGHGAIGVAHQALVSGASWLGVAIPEEGAELREAGITAPILVLGGIDETQVKTVVEYDLTQCVFSLDVARLLNYEAQRLNKKIAVHLKVDTGMGRIGLVDVESIRKFCSEIKPYSHLILEGIFTHFAAADEEDKTFTNQQMKRFSNILDVLASDGVKFKWVHAANSAAIIDCPDAHFNLVRAGIAMYGYYPSTAVKRSLVPVEPILQWETKVVHVKDVGKGDSISYGRTFIAERPMRIATLPVGYADGYSRLLSNRGWVLIHGRKAPIVGVVCMDQVMVDVTHISGVKPGDSAVLIGTQGDETISAEDIARLCGTISYEVLTGIGRRIPRIYI